MLKTEDCYDTGIYRRGCPHLGNPDKGDPMHCMDEMFAVWFRIMFL